VLTDEIADNSGVEQGSVSANGYQDAKCVVAIILRTTQPKVDRTQVFTFVRNASNVLEVVFGPEGVAALTYQSDTELFAWSQRSATASIINVRRSARQVFGQFPKRGPMRLRPGCSAEHLVVVPGQVGTGSRLRRGWRVNARAGLGRGLRRYSGTRCRASGVRPLTCLAGGRYQDEPDLAPHV
jgi:hypothetical protein